MPEYAPELPATAVYFVKELRKSGIPVGILSCNWGGTSASAWMKKERLLEDDVLKVYVNEFEDIVSKLVLKRYQMVKDMVCPAMSSYGSGDCRLFCPRCYMVSRRDGQKEGPNICQIVLCVDCLLARRME